MDIRNIEHYCLVLEAMETNLHDYRQLKNDLIKVSLFVCLFVCLFKKMIIFGIS